MSRLLKLLDFDADAAARRQSIDSFQVLFILVVGVEYWCRAVPKWGQGLPLRYDILLAVATLFCGVGLIPRCRRWAMLALGLTHFWMIAGEFPEAGNHAYLEVAFCLLIAVINLDIAEEQALFLRSARWMMLVVFFYTGVQKLAHGYYYRGQYFAFAMALDSFRALFQYVLPADEVQRLASYGGNVGDGPYILNSTLGLLVSNSVWFFEIVLGPLLLWPRTRRFAVVGIVLLLGAIEIGAREAFFGFIFLNGLLLFVSAKLHARVVPVVAFVLFGLLLVRFGVLPEVTFY